MTLLALRVGAALAHPGTDDLLAAGAGARCNVDELLALARGYAEEHRRPDAEHALDRVADCGGDPAVTALYRALVSGDEAALDAAVAANPEHAGILMTRSRLRAAEGRTAEAIADAEAVRSARPQPDDVLYLARLHETGGDPVGALAVLDDAIARIGAAPALVEEALDLELSLGRPLAAIARLDGLPRTAHWLEVRGAVLLRAGATAEASDAWSEALAITSVRSAAGRARASMLRERLAIASTVSAPW